MEEMTLEKCREQLDQIDRELVRLFERRCQVSLEVARCKEKTGKAVFDEKREQQVRLTRQSMVQDPALAGQVQQFVENILHLSKELQREYLSRRERENAPLQGKELETSSQKGPILYLGMQGSNSHLAAQKVGAGRQLIEKNSFEEIFETLKVHQNVEAVLPMENSIHGDVGAILTGIIQNGLFIRGEFSLKIENILMGKQGATIKGLKRVYSHEQALGQCSKYLSGLEGVTLVPYTSTSAAAEYVSGQQSLEKGAVANSLAMELYGLVPLQKNIADEPNNFTRFLLIGRQCRKDDSCNKISMHFDLNHTCGTLSSVLEIFQKHRANLLNIRSYPHYQNGFIYSFYVECEGNLLDPEVASLMEELNQNTLSFQILGNYENATHG